MIVKASSYGRYANKSNLCNYGDYIFYSLGSTLYRTKNDGSEKTAIFQTNAVTNLCVIDEDNVVFIDSDTTIKKLTISSDTLTSVTGNSGVTAIAINIDKDYLYYIKSDEYRLWEYEISSGNTKEIIVSITDLLKNTIKISAGGNL